MASSFLVLAQTSYWYSFRCVSFVAEVADDLVLLLLAQLELALFFSVKRHTMRVTVVVIVRSPKRAGLEFLIPGFTTDTDMEDTISNSNRSYTTFNKTLLPYSQWILYNHFTSCTCNGVHKSNCWFHKYNGFVQWPTGLPHKLQNEILTGKAPPHD